MSNAFTSNPPGCAKTYDCVIDTDKNCEDILAGITFDHTSGDFTFVAGEDSIADNPPGTYYITISATVGTTNVVSEEFTYTLTLDSCSSSFFWFYIPD